MFALVPAFSYAVTPEQLKVQIEALILQISTIQGVAAPDLSAITAPAVTTSGSSVCPNLARALHRGLRGTDVAELQRFLISEGKLSADSDTGYFGLLTERAVQEWQGQYGIVSSGNYQSTGYGMVGAKTRTSISGKCSSGRAALSCPSYPVPQCGAGMRLETTAADHAGCPGPLRCATASASCPQVHACPFGYSSQSLTTTNGCSVVRCTAPSGTSVGVRLHAPNGSEVYGAGDPLSISWSVSGLNVSDLQTHKQYRLGYWFVPTDAPLAAPALMVNSRMPDGELLSDISGVMTVKAPNGGWWAPDAERPVLESSYKLIVAIGRLDASVCDTFYGSPLRGATTSRTFAEPPVTKPCNPYRITAIDESDAIFTVREPRVTGGYAESYQLQSVTATVQVRTPDACKPYTLYWRGPASSGTSTPVIYTPPSNCTSTPHSASYTHTFEYHTEGGYRASGRADLHYNNNGFADTYIVPIHSKN